MSPKSNRIAIAILVSLAVVLAGCAGGMGSNVGTGGGQSADAPGGESGSAGPGSYYVDGERVVIREASMRVEVQTYEPAFRSVREVAREHGGFVADWDHDIERGWHSGDLTIRVPAENFTAARDDLAALGTLERENVRASDFTGQYESTGERLSDLRQRERELEGLLARTNDTAEARALLDDLESVRGQIRSVRNERESIEQREALSTIRLSIHEPVGQRPPKNYQSAFGFDDAFLDAFYGGLAVVKYVIVLFGYAIPIGFAAVLLGGVSLVWIRLWQRLRLRLDAFVPRVGEGDGAGGRDGGDSGGGDGGAGDAGDGDAGGGTSDGGSG